MNSLSSQGGDSDNMDGDAAELGMTIMKPSFGHINTKIQMKRIKRNEFVNKVPSYEGKNVISGSLSTQTSPYATKSILKNRPGTSQVTCSQITLQPFCYGMMNIPKTAEGNGRSSKKQSPPQQVHK